MMVLQEFLSSDATTTKNVFDMSIKGTTPTEMKTRSVVCNGTVRRTAAKKITATESIASYLVKSKRGYYMKLIRSLNECNSVQVLKEKTC